jgi:hypothetical protein
MLEKRDDGSLVIKAMTSPEYHESSMAAYGDNPSIHTASVHFLIRALKETIETLGIDEPRLKEWEEIEKNLPFSITDGEDKICIFENQPLDQSHRHHSHLMAIHPYDLLDFESNEKHKNIVEKSIRQWLEFGFCKWTGWSFPWASIILTRVGYPKLAHQMLSIYKRFYLGSDNAMRYLADEPVCLFNPEVRYMQIEAGMASVAAVLEMCVYTSGGILHIFEGCPDYMKDITFGGILAEGGFIIDGVKEKGKIKEIKITATFDSPLNLALPEGSYNITKSGNSSFATVAEENFNCSMAKGETLIFSLQ